MTRLQKIESEVASLSQQELAQFRAWLDEYEAEQFDQQIENDAKAGRLDRLAEQAKNDHAKGRTRPL